MKSRCISFFVEPDMVPAVLSAVDSEVLSRLSQLPDFLGFVALKSELGPRPEILAISFWEEGLENSEAISQELRDGVERFIGTAPTRKAFDILRAMVRDKSGDVVFDSP
jgi:hypothetical protein